MIFPRRRMKTFAITIFSALVLVTVSGQPSLPQQPTRSQSGQFVCYGVPLGEQRYLSGTNVTMNANLIELEPWWLAVS